MTQIQFEAVRNWLFSQALPLWGERGVDARHGGFLEELSHDGAETACAYKRLRTLCRQTYVFSHAAVLGWPGGERLSRMGVEYIAAKARLSDGGWARRLSREGEIIDATADLYDLAFVIFAMAWRYRASGDVEARRLAAETISFIRERMRGPEIGYWHTLPASDQRLQNPHMHLAEACLTAFEATGDEIYISVADEMAQLFKERLFDGRSLGERFSANWSRNTAHAELEPGHHFEWAWILAQHAKLTGVSHAREIAALIDTAEHIGVDAKTAAVHDGVSEAGAVLRGSSRIWPNTERVKAYLALYETTGRDPRREVGASLDLIFKRYFAGVRPGLWVDQFDAQGAAISQATPASCVYHLFLAFAEVLRLEPSLAESRVRA